MNLTATLKNANLDRAVTESQGILDGAREFIVSHFGQNGVYAAYALAIIVTGAVAYKLLKISIEVVFLVLLPAGIIAFVLNQVFPEHCPLQNTFVLCVVLLILGVLWRHFRK